MARPTPRTPTERCQPPFPILALFVVVVVVVVVATVVAIVVVVVIVAVSAKVSRKPEIKILQLHFCRR